MPTIAAALDAFDLEQTGDGRYRGTHLDQGHAVVFGGQLLAQALVAATRAVPDKEVLSLHNVFARGASFDEPLDIAVDVAHAGRAFATATVTTSQSGRTCTEAVVLLHAPDDDLIRHADPAPPVGPPPASGGGGEGGEWWDIAVVGGADIADPDAVGPAELQVWTRFPGAPDDLATSQALLAYASDGFLIGTAMRPHAGVGQSMAHVSVSTTVLAQTLSFHEPFHAGDWLLLDHRSAYAGRGRSHGDARVFAADGRLVASFSQENMIRAMPGGPKPPGERARF